MAFEVQIPNAANPSEQQAIVVEASDWFSALRIALKQVDESEVPRNVMCDVDDQETYHITDPTSGRIFTIRNVPSPSPPLDTTVQDLGNTVKTTPIDTAKTELHIPSFEEPSRPSSANKTTQSWNDLPTPETQSNTPTQPNPPVTQPNTPTTQPDTPQQTFPPDDPPPHSISISDLSEVKGKYKPGFTEEILTDLFMRIMDIYDYGENRAEAMEFALSLGLKQIHAHNGCILLSDINNPSGELWFEAAQGPHADTLLNFRVPIGQGIVGWCVHENASLVIANAKDDPRFAKDVLQNIDAEIGSVLCAPIHFQDRTHGAILLYNTPQDRPFTQGELSITNYLAFTMGEYLSSLIK